MIKRNTIIPCEVSKSYVTGEDNQDKFMIDISNDQKALRRLKVACEQAKIDLSNQNDTFIEVQSLSQDIDFELIITRKEFEKICQPKFNICIEKLKNIIEDSKISKNKINEILLIYID